MSLVTLPTSLTVSTHSFKVKICLGQPESGSCRYSPQPQFPSSTPTLVSLLTSASASLFIPTSVSLVSDHPARPMPCTAVKQTPLKSWPPPLSGQLGMEPHRQPSTWPTELCSSGARPISSWRGLLPPPSHVAVSPGHAQSSHPCPCTLPLPVPAKLCAGPAPPH